jgi:hypothetical protein
LELVAPVLSEGEERLRGYMKQQEKLVKGQLLEVREILGKQYQRVQSMR